MTETVTIHREIRMVLQGEAVEVYVYCETGAARGWHHKAFAPGLTPAAILARFADDPPATWPHRSPTGTRRV